MASRQMKVLWLLGRRNRLYQSSDRSVPIFVITYFWHPRLCMPIYELYKIVPAVVTGTSPLPRDNFPTIYLQLTVALDFLCLFVVFFLNKWYITFFFFSFFFWVKRNILQKKGTEQKQTAKPKINHGATANRSREQESGWSTTNFRFKTEQQIKCGQPYHWQASTYRSLRVLNSNSNELRTLHRLQGH